MTSAEYYWCLTHERVEAADDRDDVDNCLGPYPSAEAARNWKVTNEARDEKWQEADDEWFGGDEVEDTHTSPKP